jgi:hypothetical protein
MHGFLPRPAETRRIATAVPRRSLRPTDLGTGRADLDGPHELSSWPLTMIAGAALPRTSICCDVRGPTVTAAVDPVVHLASAHRRVRGIVVVPGRIEADVIETTNLELPNTRPIRGGPGPSQGRA